VYSPGRTRLSAQRRRPCNLSGGCPRPFGENRISVESTYAPDVVARLASFGHEIISGEGLPTVWPQPHDFLHSFMPLPKHHILCVPPYTIDGGRV
jgi:hypothetical protein